MMPYRFPALAVLLAALALGACQPTATETGKVIATVNGQPITEAEFQQYLQLRQQREPLAAGDQQKLLDEMIDRVLLTQRAEADGIDEDPEVQHLLARMRENILVQSLIGRMLQESPITEEELRQRFETEVAATHKTEYLVRHILTKDEEEAREIIGELKSKKADFAKLAKQKSIDVQSGNRGGSLGWINQGMVVPEFFQGVTRLEKGAVSPEPVQSEFGWHVIRVDDTRPAKIPTFEEFMADPQTRSNFQRKLQDERIERIVKDLRANAKIEIRNE